MLHGDSGFFFSEEKKAAGPSFKSPASLPVALPGSTNKGKGRKKRRKRAREGWWEGGGACTLPDVRACAPLYNTKSKPGALGQGPVGGTRAFF